MARKATPPQDETTVLEKSARRCALCFYLVGDLTEKPDGRMQKLMQISFWTIITSDADEPLMILEAYPEGTELELSNFGHRLIPRRPQRMMISGFVLPIIGKPGEALRTRFVLKDQYGRTYYTPKTNFRWISSGIEKQTD